jgi:hypothetical protein
MQTDQCRAPLGSNREPWGLAQVSSRATSTIASVSTTETEEGAISPYRLKFATNA